MESPSKLIGANLKRARQTLRLSQTIVGKHIGVPRQGIAAIETGRRAVTVDQLLQLTNLLRRELQWFLEPPRRVEAFPQPHIQKRSNPGKSGVEPDQHDWYEIGAFDRDLRRLQPTAANALWSKRRSANPLRPVATIAEEVRQLSDLTTPPVNIYRALSCFGLRARSTTLHLISGAFISGGGTWPPGVLINSDQPYERQRYSAAHELGHFVLNHAPDGTQPIVSPLGRRFEPKEVEADSFAAEFLMPTSMIAAELKQLSSREKLEDHVYRLADRFLVSFQAMTLRLSHLGFVTATQKNVLLKMRPSDLEEKLQLKKRAKKAFDPKGLKKICATAKIVPELLTTADGVRQLQELAFEEYARLVPEAERRDTAGGIYEKVALWVASEYPIRSVA
jgi:Zn-dependent peptidase ImmA (M78 family)/transcriptional regulator with XRE-family HTH domain